MEPQPRSPLGARLTDIFNYRWNWLKASLEESSLNTKWETVTKYPLKPRILWKCWQDANTVIGIRFGSSTKYGVIDIDKDSPYIDEIDLIQAALETIGIVRTVPIRSSWSGGIHLYCPLPKSYPTFSVACALTMALEAQGIHIAPGQCEVFPNMKPYTKFWLGEFSDYNGHRLPLQPATGSCCLSDDLQPIAGGEDLSRFFALWDNALLHQDRDELEQALIVARNNKRNRKRATGPVESWRGDLEHVIAEGWTGHGQTNGLLKDIACYGRVFEGLEGVHLAEYIERIATSRPGYEKWCGHQHEIWRKACTWGRAAEKYYWPLGTEPLRERKTLMSICEERAAEARDRIADVCRQIQFEGQTVKALVKKICQQAKCSASTLYKNKDLWHPDSRPVTPEPESDTDDLATIQALVKESFAAADLARVTGLGEENEACILDSLPLKKFTQGEKGGSRGERGDIHSPWPLDGAFQGG